MISSCLCIIFTYVSSIVCHSIHICCIENTHIPSLHHPCCTMYPKSAVSYLKYFVLYPNKPVLTRLQYRGIKHTTRTHLYNYNGAVIGYTFSISTRSRGHFLKPMYNEIYHNVIG